MSAQKKSHFQVVIGAVTTKFKRGMERVKNGITCVSKSLAKMGAIGAGVGVAIAAGFAILVSKSLKAIDKIGKLSRVIGLSTKQLGSMGLAAELGGMELEGFAKASKQVSKAVFDYIVRGTGEAADAFDKLGITQQDLIPIQNDQMAILTLLSAKFSKLEDGAVKSALGVKMFGSRGADMMNVMAGGPEMLRRNAEEAKLFGLAMSKGAVAGVEEANDAMTRNKSLLGGIMNQITAALAPAITMLADLFRNELLDSIKENGGSVQSWAKIVATSILETIKSVISSIRDLSIGTVRILGKLYEFMKWDNTPMLDTFRGVFDALHKADGVMDKLIAKTKAKIIVPVTTGDGSGDEEVTKNIKITTSFVDEFVKTVDWAFGKVAKNLKSSFESMNLSLAHPIKSLGKSIADTFKKAGDKIYSEIVGNLLQKLMTKMMKNTAIGSMFGCAGGGRMAAGTTAWVGERGPERITTSRNATIMNASDSANAMSGGGGLNLTQHLHFDVGLESTAGMIAAAIPGTIEAAANAALNKLNRGG